MTRLPLLLSLLFASAAMAEGTLKNIQISAQRAEAIGQRIWQNEGLGKVENLIVWNKGEDFPSLGIGHFIWYPPGVDGPFTESFPQLLHYLRKTTPLPAWLSGQTDAPWRSRDEFYADIDSPRMVELSTLLQRTIPQQTRFIIKRLHASLPAMLATLQNEEEKREVANRFYQVANSPGGLYALIDYVNFKGEGISPGERYKGEGWGLLQVLKNMRPDTEETMKEFIRCADFVLTRRVDNAPRDESRWLNGWRKRLGTYAPH